VLYPSTSQVGDPPTSQEVISTLCIATARPPSQFRPEESTRPPARWGSMSTLSATCPPCLSLPSSLRSLFIFKQGEVWGSLELHQVMSPNHLISIPLVGGSPIWVVAVSLVRKVLVQFPDAFLNSPQFCAVQFSFK